MLNALFMSVIYLVLQSLTLKTTHFRYLTIFVAQKPSVTWLGASCSVSRGCCPSSGGLELWWLDYVRIGFQAHSVFYVLGFALRAFFFLSYKRMRLQLSSLLSLLSECRNLGRAQMPLFQFNLLIFLCVCLKDLVGFLQIFLGFALLDKPLLYKSISIFGSCWEGPGATPCTL